MRTLIAALIAESDSTLIEVEHNYASSDALLAAIREHVNRWLRHDPQSRQAYRETCADFNWGGLLVYAVAIPDVTSFRTLNGTGDIVVVDHDEQLATDRLQGEGLER